tara:strand:- start:590 stop:805 length:216 start_codon:yes stop_codon:yes gene_type:complete
MDSSFTQAHHDSPFLVDFVNLMPKSASVSWLGAAIAIGRTFRHPEIAFMVKEEAMGEREKAGTKTVDQIPL